MSASDIQHPAPQPGLGLKLGLGFAVFAPPVAWFVVLVAVASTGNLVCTATTQIGWGGWRITWLVLAAVATAIALAGVAITWGSWRASGEHAAAAAERLALGRRRWLSLCGLLASIEFSFAGIFMLMAVFLVPACG